MRKNEITKNFPGGGHSPLRKQEMEKLRYYGFSSRSRYCCFIRNMSQTASPIHCFMADGSGWSFSSLFLVI